jgi:hypothetical protein
VLSIVLAAAIATAAPAPSKPAAAPDADPKVCHVEPIQGSHKVCLRASEAALLRREARRMLDHAQSGAQAPNMATMVQMGPLR